MGCSCVRRGEPCTNCTPSHNGRSENLHGALPPAYQPEPHPSKKLRPVAEATELMGRMNADRGGDYGVLLDNRLPAKECAMRTPIITSSRVESSRQNENLNLRSIEVSEDPKELTNSSPQKTAKDRPPFTALSVPNFRWGDIDGAAFSSKVNKAYEAAVHWKRNLFKIPRGRVGIEFVREISRLIDAYSGASALESVALKASMISELYVMIS